MTTIITCDCCGKRIHRTEEYYESTSGEYMCEECGDNLFIHELTQHDEYPYIDGEATWDGGQYEGDQYKKVSL